jgi:hypothetical protein
MLLVNAVVGHEDEAIFDKGNVATQTVQLWRRPQDHRQLFTTDLSSVGKLDQAGILASACTGLYRQKGKINPGDEGSQPKHLHIRRDIKTTNKHLLVLDPMVFLFIF